MQTRFALTAALIAALLPQLAFARPITATVYDPWYNGRPTACGNVYRHHAISAAHRFLPCGTPVRISHHGKHLTVPITDRCDCTSIDLSAGAARRLGVPLNGIATVYIQH